MSTKRLTTRRSKPPPPPPTPIPTPFTRAPVTLHPFLDRCDPARVHITHLDRLPRAHKRRIFLIPVVLNLTIAALLAWRAWVALPYYLVLLRTFAGQPTSLTVDPTLTSRRERFGILAWRVAGMFGDFLLFRFVGPWPLTFFAEQPANPVTWRWTLGFREEEVVVRVSRGWGNKDLMEGVKRGEENAFFKNRVLPAIGVETMGKTGYLMMDGNWDLEFELMQDAHTLMERGEIKGEEVDGVVWAFLEGVGWIGWRWQEGQGGEEARRRQVVRFKETLTKMGKESLFWKWTEIVEEERDGDGGFTREGQQKVAKRVQEEFGKEGVDFEKLTESIGGLAEVSPPKG